MVVSWIGGLAVLIVGIILYGISRVPELDSLLQRILYYIGIVAILIGAIILVIALIFLIV